MASESHGWSVDMLSKATHQELVAAITRSRSFRGVVRSGAVEGSTRERTRRSAVLLALPCSPWKRSTGYGPLGLKACTSQVQTSLIAPSSVTLIKALRRSSRPHL